MRRSRAFTLIELLVVIGIIGLIMAIALPAVFYAREASRRNECSNHVRQLAVAVNSYHGARRHLPTGHFYMPGGNSPESTSWSWLANLLPYVEQKNLYETGNVSRGTISASRIADSQILAFLCPSDPFSRKGPSDSLGDLSPFPAGQTNYQAVSGSNWGHDKSQNSTGIGTDWPNKGTNGSYDGWDEGDGIMQRSDFRRPRSFRHVTDGQARTLMIGEQAPEQNRWCSWPYANNAYGTCAIPPNVVPREGGNYEAYWWPNVAGFRSVHPGGLHFACADGSVHFVADEIDLDMYRALATIAGAEPGQVP